MSSSSSKLFSVLYCIYLVLAILNPQILLLGIPVRHVLTFVMLVMCLMFSRKNGDWFVKLYFVFVFFTLVAGVTTGYGKEAFMKLIGTYLVAIVIYMSTFIMVEKFKKVHVISVLLLTVFAFDAIVTIGQYYNLPQFIFLPQMIGIEMEYLDLFNNGLNMEGTFLAGLVGPVANGYMLSAAAILAWYPYKKFSLLLNVSGWLLFIVASFYTQERAGFYAAIVFTLYIIYLRLKEKEGMGKIIIVLGVIFLFFYAGSIIESITSVGRYQMGTEGNRDAFFSDGWDFFIQNPMGGVDLYKSTHHFMPHNLFANVFIAGGAIGGLLLLFIISLQCLQVARFLLSTKTQNSWIPILFGIMYLDYTAQSLVHNPSLAYGTVLFFVFWGVFSCFYKQTKSVNNKQARKLSKV